MIKIDQRMTKEKIALQKKKQRKSHTETNTICRFNCFSAHSSCMSVGLSVRPSVHLSPAIPKRTLVQNNQEYRLKYWATRSSICSFACTAHLFACSSQLASLTGCAALTRLLARSLCHSLDSKWLFFLFFFSVYLKTL